MMFVLLINLTLQEIPLKLLQSPVNSSWGEYKGQDWAITK
jgi:hypothetical protein